MRYKYLVCISSFKRPIQLLGQIHRFYKQTYNNFDISVCVKGCDNFVYNIILEECSIYPNLILNKETNKDQLTNLLDCIKYADAKQYDYFIKVDDDDIYSLNYVLNINEQLNLQEHKPLGFYNNNIHQIKEQNNKISYIKKITNLYGNTLGFNFDIYSILLKKDFTKYNISNTITRSKTKEDALIDRIMRHESNLKRPYVNIKLDNQVYYCNLSQSVLNYHAQ